MKSGFLWLLIISFGFFLLFSVIFVYQNKYNTKAKKYKCGEQIAIFNGVAIYYNDDNICKGRNLSIDGYNFGLKWQCVEFIKRYYYTVFLHKMPDSYGNAKDFFDTRLKDGEFNKQRGLYQYAKISSAKPQIHDIIIFDKHIFNPFGHIAIISKVTDTQIEWVQQNVGLQTKDSCPLKKENKQWHIQHGRVLGILRGFKNK
jgi:hypothetical protein